MNHFNHYYLDSIKNRFADFDGRASRSEYWYFALFNFAIFMGAGIIAGILGTISPKLTMIVMGILSLFMIALLIPSLALTVRRLHDTGKSGWMLLLGLIPLVGPIILLVFYVTESTPGLNEYGPNPLEIEQFGEEYV
jgi:uncharacterized membrane protein YhaH (DUF805 family)